LGAIFGFRTLLAFGFKKKPEDNPHKELIDFVITNTPRLDIPRLRRVGEKEASSDALVELHPLNTKTTGPKRTK